MTRRSGIALGVVLLALVAAGIGAFLLGRRTAPLHDRGWAQGYSVGYDEGVSVGRALQSGDTLPSSTRDLGTQAFQAGYRAAQADSFGGYDGGWSIGRPYMVVIGHGLDGAPYRIADRELLEAGETYRLCPDETKLCQS
jgi:hypothetical protein